MTDIPAARRAVERYVATINERRFSDLGSLFAPDAVFLAPDGRTIEGREAIGQFYEAALPKIGALRNWIHSAVTEGNVCVMELAAQLGSDGPDAPPRIVVDHFTVDDAGLVTRMAVYLRPAEVESTRRALG